MQHTECTANTAGDDAASGVGVRALVHTHTLPYTQADADSAVFTSGGESPCQSEHEDAFFMLLAKVSTTVHGCV